MSDFDEARAEVIAALAEYGDLLPVHRPSASYNAATRTLAAGYSATQELRGRFDPAGKGNSHFGDSVAKVFERMATLSPDGMIFEPAVGDLVEAEGRLWRIEALKITRGGGLVLVIEAGLVAA